MFLVLWEFEVKPGSEDSFESIYGPAGAWAQLFSTDASYLETRLLRDVYRARTYTTMDYWKSQSAYKNFRSRNSEAYKTLDETFEALTHSERHLGSAEY